MNYEVESGSVQHNAKTNTLIAPYDYCTTRVERSGENGRLRVIPTKKTLVFKTNCNVPRVGCMLVGWGGNNGSTVTASVLANKLKLRWRTKEGERVGGAGSLQHTFIASINHVYEPLA